MIRVEHLRKQLGNKQVLSDVSFTVEPGTIFALIGPNGAGKTTTIRCLTGALQADGGQIELFGENYKNFSQIYLKERMAVVPEERHVFRNFTAKDYVQIWSRLYSKWDDTIFSNFVARYSFDLSQKVESYSIGMKTILFVGLCVASQADLLILDEPTQHLDPTVRLEIMDMLKECASSGRTILISSHEIFEIEEYATHFGIIKEGRVIYSDSIDNAKENHRIVDKGENLQASDVIGLVGSSVLVKTKSDVGRYPRLNEIVVGYLTGHHERSLSLR
ncbi:MAG TPA: ABC transporter ATP-binding protein [Pseudothermotoga sp.]|nr:ABC transporter ATP-binding protein [Pseudothermotoga sp.]HOK82659.1 ABC transporter ATP-binding protein [Pseudothermotoga sp.]HPP70420.1 ABC transporter ATP-binding protein [Pseudothermotoga sp.]